MTYQVNELFTSVQGEGHWIGRLATFIRLQGCTVGCPWCDSRKTWGLNVDTPGYMRGYLKGVRQGDGSISGDSQDGHKRFYLQVTDEEIPSTFAKYVKVLFDVDINFRLKDNWARHPEHKPVYTMAFGRKEVVAFLDEPVSDDPEERRGYVAGMFDCEGTHVADHKRMSFSNKDLGKLDLIREILTAQDMRAWISEPDREVYRLSIVPAQREKFFDYFHPKVERKYGGYTSLKGGTRMTVEEIVSQVKAHHVVITGGEPTLYNLDPLILALHSMNKYVSLETSGQNNLKGMLVPDWVTWSPKGRLNWDAPYYIKVMADEVKWVVDEELQWETVQATWDFYMQYSPPTEVYFMPEGCPPRPEMIAKTLDWMHNKVSNDPTMMERCFISDRLQYRLSVR